MKSDVGKKSSITMPQILKTGSAPLGGFTKAPRVAVYSCRRFPWAERSPLRRPCTPQPRGLSPPPRVTEDRTCEAPGLGGAAARPSLQLSPEGAVRMPLSRVQEPREPLYRGSWGCSCLALRTAPAGRAWANLPEPWGSRGTNRVHWGMVYSAVLVGHSWPGWGWGIRHGRAAVQWGRRWW